jgi:hypothetical protein
MAWIARQNCCEIPDSMTLEFVVRRLAIAPGDIWSTVLTDCLKIAERYAIRSLADILTPLILTASYLVSFDFQLWNLTMAIYDRTKREHPR